VGNLWRAAAQWTAQFRDDLAASIDAGVLGVARFVGLLYGPIDEQLPITEALRKSLGYRLAPHVTWRHALGGIAHLFFIALVVTGVLLSVHYRPSVQEAYPSIQHIVSEVTLGWLMRDLHVWAANLIVFAILAHMARVFFDAAYKPPRETSWLVGLGLLGVVLTFGATGALLPWDQAAYWTVSEALNGIATVPLVGGLAAGLLRGDPIVSGATLSRFFSVHVIVLPWFAFALLLFHFKMVRRHGIAPPKHPPAIPTEGSGRRFFPNHLLRSFSVAAVVCALMVTLAVFWPRPVGEPANPAQAPLALHTTWVVADVSRALTYYFGAWGFVGFSVLGLGLALVPLLDRDRRRDLRRRPVATALGVTFFLGFIVFWILGSRLHEVTLEPPTPTQQVGAHAP